MTNYLERLNAILKEKKELNYYIEDVTPLYYDFNDKYTTEFNYIYKNTDYFKNIKRIWLSPSVRSVLYSFCFSSPLY